MSKSPYQSLLIVALVLAVVKFAIVPWVGQQAGQRDILEQLTQRVDRLETVLERKSEISAQHSKLTVISQDFNARFPLERSSDNFKLQTQQKLAELAERSGVAITVFDFVSEGDQPKANLKYLRVRMQIRGLTSGVVRFQSELEGGLQNAIVRSLSIAPSVPMVSGNDTVILLTIAIDFYFQPS